jgi:hypothetical protein
MTQWHSPYLGPWDLKNVLGSNPTGVQVKVRLAVNLTRGANRLPWGLPLFSGEKNLPTLAI